MELKWQDIGRSPFLNKQFDKLNRLFIKSEKPDWKYPMESGYANVGVVTEVGREVKNISKGDKVFAYVSHRTDYIIEENNVIKLPENISSEYGIFTALLTISFNGILDAQINLGETIAIFGLGVIG